MGKHYYRWIFVIYGIALLVTGALRVYLEFYGIDHATGFYITGGWMVTVFNWTLGLAAVGLLLLNRLRITDNDYPVLRKGRLTSGLGLLVGAAIILYMLESGGIFVIGGSQGIALEGARAWLGVILGGISAVAYLWTGAKGALGVEKRTNGVLLLMPAIWQASLVVMKYNEYTTLTTVSDNLLLVLFMSFCAMFIIGYARTTLGFARKDGRNYLIPMGLLTSLAGLVLTVPNFLYMLVWRTGMPALSLGLMESVYIFCMSVYALSAVREVRRSIVFV